MKQVVQASRVVVVTVVAAGLLTMGAVWLSGSASAGPLTSPKAISRFNCDRATKVLTRFQKLEAQISAGLPKLNAAEAKAKAKGNTKRVDRLQKRITKLESSTFKDRLTSATSAIENKCHVAAPAVPPASTTTTTAPPTSTTAAPSSPGSGSTS